MTRRGASTRPCVVEKMTEFLRSATERHTREETVSRISELAERYAPTTQWFIDTMNAMFAIGGDVAGGIFRARTRTSTLNPNP
jgi:hypothetical protein